MTKPLAERIFDWDDYVEDHDREQAVKPFDAGIMLAVAKVLTAWDEADRDDIDFGWNRSMEEAIENLRSTAEQVIA